MGDMINILILCTGNSARSILGETLVNSHADKGFQGYSAGSKPTGEPNPFALAVLEANGHDVSGLASKSWDVFAEPDAPEMHAVITVCDSAADEVCPVWPGHPVQAHWGLPDPANIEEMNFRRAAFEDTYTALRKRVGALVELPWGELGAEALRARIQAIHDG
ncbi:MAG: arsenate reductase ArsC [Pseudomonadota bacterium]